MTSLTRFRSVLLLTSPAFCSIPPIRYTIEETSISFLSPYPWIFNQLDVFFIHFGIFFKASSFQQNDVLLYEYVWNTDAYISPVSWKSLMISWLLMSSYNILARILLDRILPLFGLNNDRRARQLRPTLWLVKKNTWFFSKWQTLTFLVTNVAAIICGQAFITCFVLELRIHGIPDHRPLLSLSKKIYLWDWLPTTLVTNAYGT